MARSEGWFRCQPLPKERTKTPYRLRPKKTPNVPQQLTKATNSRWGKKLLYPAIVVVVALALYAKTLSFDFVYHDDDKMIVNNALKLELASLSTVLLTDAWFGEKQIQLYRPWQSLTYLLDYKLWKVNPAGYHLHNVLVFALALSVLYFFLQLLSFNKPWAFRLTLFYACHYLFAHTVCWIPARGDLYLMVFGLLAIGFLLTYFRRRLGKALLWANVFLFLALLAKETAVVIVPVAVLLRWGELKFDLKQLKGFIGPWWLPSALVASVYWLLRSQSIDTMGYVSWGGALYNLPVIPESVFKFFIPAQFAVLPGYNATLTIAGMVLILVMTVVVVARRTGASWYLMITGLCMFLLSLLPSLVYKPAFTALAYDYLDHRMFFAGVGLLVFSGAAFMAFPSQSSRLQTGVLALCVVEAAFSFHYQEAYRDYQHYYQNGMATNPKSALAMLNYGILLRERDRDIQKSVEVFAQGSRAFPDYTAFLRERAGSFFVMQEYDSMYAVAQAMAKYPDRQYEALVYSGIYYNHKGLTDAALSAFSRAIELNPRSYSTRFNRATVYKQLKNWDGMVADLSEAIRLNPDYADAYAERGKLYAHLGHLDEALSDYGKYVSLRPEDPSGFHYRGQVLCLLGRKVAGENDLHKAAEMGFPEAGAKRGQLTN